MKLAFSLLLTFALAPAALAQDVLGVVKGIPPGLPGYYDDIPEAVAAAQPGDIIIVNFVEFDTVYTAATIDKPLTIAGRAEDFGFGPGQLPFVAGEFRIENVDGDQPVRLWRMQTSSGGAGSTALVIDNCSAPVVLEGMVMFGGGVGISNCDNVVFSDSAVRGIDAVNSSVSAYQSFASGGFSGGTQAGALGAGIRMEGGQLFLSGTDVYGAFGTPSGLSGGACTAGGKGGDGVLLEGGALLQRRDSELVAGTGGASVDGCPAGADGAGLAVVSGTVQELPGSSPTVAIDEVIWQAGFLISTIPASAPGDLVFTIYSTSLQPLQLQGGAGLLLPANPVVKYRGITNSFGTSPVTFQVPPNPSGGSGSVLELQYAHLDPNSLSLILGPPISAVWL